MLTLNSNNIVSLGMSIEGREFTRYFSGFALSSLDQEVLCYHKKQIIKKNWKDVGSGQSVFISREKSNNLSENHQEFFDLCTKEGELMIRDGVVQGMHVHIALTGDRMGKEDEYTKLVHDLWKEYFVVVQTIIQTKDFPLIQWSITDPTLLQHIVQSTHVANNAETSIVIGSVVRRDNVLEALINWCEEQGYNADLFDQYDIALLECDPS